MRSHNCGFFYTPAGLAVCAVCLLYAYSAASEPPENAPGETASIVIEETENTDGLLTIRLEDARGVRIASALLFKPGRADLSPYGKDVLDRALEKAAEFYPQRELKLIRVESHTDDRPTDTPQYPSNWYLSAARAVNVGIYFSEAGVDPAIIQTIGKGRHHPLGSNETPEGQEMNNRIEIIYYAR